jgi:uncharacterized repeat protein (TIGR03803 family)
MNNCIKHQFLLPMLAASLSFMLADRVTAQTFTTLYSFSPTSTSGSTYGDNSDGADPYAGLVLSGNTFYGTAQNGGNKDLGAVFALNADDNSFRTVWRFVGSSEVGPTSEAVEPEAALTVSGGTLYGTAPFGGSAGRGAVFSLQTNGGPYMAVHNFSSLSGTGGILGTNSDGAVSYAGVILSGNTLYGTAFVGGLSGWGSVFAVNTNSTGFTNLHSFTGGSNGADPYGGLILSGNTLYGTTSGGFIPTAQSGFGTVFAINTDGTGFTTLYSFTNGSDGSQPFGSLILSGNVLYGTAYGGGSAGWGTVFALNTNDSVLTTLYSFTNGSDGSQPWAGLILAGNTLCGTATRGGGTNSGTVFSVTTNGSNFTTLHSFSATVYNGNSAYTNSDGDSPLCGLVLSGNTLYGTAELGGTGGSGTVFSISLPAPPQQAIILSGTNVILTWPTNATGLTNPISGSQMFFRLAQ